MLPIYTYGRFLPGSILVVDTLGADCEDTGLVWEDGDADRIAVRCRARWCPRHGWATMSARSCCPFMSSTARPTTWIRAMSCKGPRPLRGGCLTPVVACELEYYLVDIERGHDGQLMPATAFTTGRKPARHPGLRPA